MTQQKNQQKQQIRSKNKANGNGIDVHDVSTDDKSKECITKKENNKDALGDNTSITEKYYIDKTIIGKELIIDAHSQKLTTEHESIDKNNTDKDLIMDNTAKESTKAHVTSKNKVDENGIDFKYHQASYMFDFYRHLAKPYKTDSIGK